MIDIHEEKPYHENQHPHDVSIFDQTYLEIDQGSWKGLNGFRF